MFCAYTRPDSRREFTGPLVLWLLNFLRKGSNGNSVLKQTAQIILYCIFLLYAEGNRFRNLFGRHCFHTPRCKRVLYVS